MAVGKEEVEKIARLARLRLTPAEVETLPGQLSRILEHVEKFRALDLAGIAATSHVLDLGGGMRDDAPGACLPLPEALYNAPAEEDGLFLVPRVMKVY